MGFRIISTVFVACFIAAAGTAQVTEIVSVDDSEGEADGHSTNPALSGNGRFVCFGSAATNLVPGDNNQTEDVFVRDRVLGTTQRVSVSTSGAEANGGAGEWDLSSDGRIVVFSSIASNLVANDTNGRCDVLS